VNGGLDRTTKLAVGAAGATRAAAGGMLATALAVFVGRRGSPLAVGLLGSVFFFGMMVFAPLWGSVGDVLGRRRRLLVGLSTAAAMSSLAFVAVRSVAGVVGFRFVYAAFAVGVGPLLLSAVSSLGGRTHRGRAVGFLNSALAAGDVGGQFLVGVLLGLLAPSGVYAVVALVGLLATAAVTRLPDPPTEEPPKDDAAPRAANGLGRSPDDSGRSPDDSTPSAGRFDRSPDDLGPSAAELATAVRARLFPPAAERALLREKGLGRLYAGLFARHAAVKGVGSLVPVYLLSVVGVSTVTMGALLTVGSAAQLGFMPASGRLADAGPRRRLIFSGMAASGAYALVLATAPSFDAGLLRTATAGASFVLLAAGFSAMDVGVVSLLADAAPERETTLVGLRSTATGAGGVVGPVLVGVAVSLVGYQFAFALAGLLSFAAAGLVVGLPEPDREPRGGTEERPVVSPADRTVETAAGIPRPMRGDDD